MAMAANGGLVAAVDVGSAAETVLQELLDSVLLDASQQVHRELKTLGMEAVAQELAPAALPAQMQNPNTDIFGQTHPPKATDVVTCRNCGRQVQAGTFAPHLEKCMGRGRAAARAASRRLQTMA